MNQPVRILYVDDYPLDRELVRDALEKDHSGFELVEAASRAEFEATLAQGGFDLVLSDFNILGFEGLQILDAVRATDSHLPVIIVTGTGSEEIAAEAIKRGAADYVIKTPKHIHRLPHTIHAVLENKRLEDERQQAEEALRVSEARYRQIVETAQEGIWMIEAEGRTTFVNPKLAEMLGYTVNEMLGSTLYHFMDEEGISIATSKVENRRQGIADQHEFKYLRKDGSIIWMLLNTNPIISDSGSYLGALAMLSDITERKQAEKALQEYSTRLEIEVAERTHELRDAQEQLVQQERLAMLGRLAGGVGHELRNPLGVISNAIYFLKLIQPKPDEKVGEYLRIIEDEIHIAEKIIIDLLDYSRNTIAYPEHVDVLELVQHVLSRYLVPTSIQVKLNIPADLPRFFADPRQIEQVLNSLMANACQALPEGGVITFSALQEGQMVAISIKDTGVGIPSEDMKKIFEPLFTTKAKGLGLGLTVSQKLAEANDGRIEVASESGKGSTFTLYLPISKEPK